ncbi:HD-GYP domain-containing protein [Vibrio hangzhouensis]|uniref:HD-GYP domain, c-di-GMP phosphodiesterase class II (Or its inactivated variant) n=1 Tax=Vibrio hangzhouensis TaxID=462991 RepID=A0A1H5TNZ2_9VIBR|nr:HD domain-containing phosphohydrolase [Vibrio hangzhouensis]SEF64535.1 HD-GYP domain, c-di-GMP phosphodiesterase class II (or its inactivated variant) [Vibrio hangzhouensis]
MPTSQNRIKRLTFPLHIHISAIFVVLVIIVCGVQIWITHTSLNKVILNANENLFERIAGETRSNMSFHFGPAFSIVDAYSAGELVREVVPSKRFDFVPELVSQLRANRHIFALKAAFPDGEWLSVARVTDNRMRDQINLGPNAEFAALNYNSETNTLLVKTYSAHLGLLQSKTIHNFFIDPRKAKWYRSASLSAAKVSEPYYMPIISRSGITISRKATNGAVFGADILLDQVSLVLQDSDENRDALRVLYDDSFNVYAYSRPELFEIRDALRQSVSLKLGDIDHPLVSSTANMVEFGDEAKEITYNDEKWVVKVDRLRGTRDQTFNMVMAVKSEQLLKNANLVAKRSLVGSFFALLFALPCIYFLSQLLAKPIRQATKKADSIQHFQFHNGSQEASRVSEIKAMSDSLSVMQSTIRRFLSLTNSMAKEDDLEKLLELVCEETVDATGANGAYLYLLSSDEKYLEPKFVKLSKKGVLDVAKEPRIPLDDARLADDVHDFFVKKQPVYSKYYEERPFVTKENATDNLLFIPLLDRKQNVIGGLGLGFDEEHETQVLMDDKEYLETLASYASVTIETQTMLADQRALLDSFIQVMAGAIDTKSPYTGNHCQRVPVLTEMLTQAAQDSKDSAFADFSMSKEQWQELHIAAWLHDCGKVTTPEHVIDKSTKLETIYNRIHEVRTRFEVLKRDVELKFYRTKYTGELSASDLESVHKQQQALDDEFSFLARINLGTESLEPDQLERLKAIARRTWQPTIDPGLGMSWQELSRCSDTRFNQQEQVPVLSDSMMHKIPWDKAPVREDRFVLQAGEYQNDLGELYNLSIEKGTLNAEERYIINSHMIETIRMLESLPFPKHMKNVPMLAGSHHEKADGSGYPLGLKASELPIPARAMAIADVFEALTSGDRPYKKAKTLSEAIKIMSFMVKDGHLDSSLFRLFLQSGVYMQFANHFLSSEQLDDVDIEKYL